MTFTLHTSSEILLALTLLLCGGYAGMCLMCQIGVLPTMRDLGPRQYAEVWRIMDGYMDRAMPPYKLTLLALNLGTVVCLLLEHRTALATIATASFLLSLVALILTITQQLPLNAKLKSLPADTEESVLLRIRQQTVRNFTVRSVLAIVAFTILCFGVTMTSL